MKVFRYRAKQGPEKVVEGTIKASSTEEAVALLSREGYVPTLLEEIVKSSQGKPVVSEGIRGVIGTNRKDLISFTRQLSVLTKSGVPIVRGLNILAGQSGSTYFKRVASDVAEHIRDGGALSSGLAKYPRVFSRFYIAMVSAGEESGSIDNSLRRLADYYQEQARVVAKIRAATAYPLFIAVVGVFTVIFVFTNVMPRIIPVLLSIDTALPLPTRVLMFISEFLAEKWGWIILWITLFILMFVRALKNHAFSEHISSIKLKLPLFGQLISRAELARFFRALEICITSGVPIINAAAISMSLLGERHIKNKLAGSVRDLEKGKSLTEIFSESGVFPDLAVNLVNVGEESGDLTGSFGAIADSFETDCGDAVELVLSVLEPSMVLIVGLVVGFIVSAVLLPVFQMNVLQM